MKVTEEMISRAIAAVEVEEPDGALAHAFHVARRKYMRTLLEAALADLPDIEDLPALLAVAEARLADVRAQLARLGRALADLNEEG